MTSPRVSVIIPAYNTAHFIAETLDSALRQTYTDFELIVVNDGSPDTEALERVLARYMDRIVYVVQANKGLAGARNTALAIAKGEYVANLDSDDRWQPEFLECVVGALDENSELAMVFPDARRFDESGFYSRRLSDDFSPRGPITFSRVLARQVQVFGCATARAEVLRAVGGYDEALRTGEDFDLWLRLLKGGYGIGFVDRVLLDYRVNPASLTANALGQERGVRLLLDRLAEKMSLSDEERVILDVQRSSLTASIDLLEGKAALAACDMRGALAKLRSAYAHRGGWKLAGMVAALTVAPWGVEGILRAKAKLR